MLKTSEKELIKSMKKLQLDRYDKHHSKASSKSIIKKYFKKYLQDNCIKCLLEVH